MEAVGARSEEQRFAAAWRREFPGVRISPTEAEVVFMLTSGMTTAEVASTTYRSPKTIEAHLAHLAERCRVARSELRRRLIYAMGREAGIDE